MKYTLTIEADSLEELRALIGNTSVTNEAVQDDPRDVYGSGNGPVDAAQPVSANALVDAAQPVSANALVDSAGVEFNPDIHAGEDKTNKDGTWRKKRGAPATPATPATSATPATPATLPEPGFIMTSLAAAMQKQEIAVDYIQNLTREFNMESLADIGHNEDLRARVVEKLRADGVL